MSIPDCDKCANVADGTVCMECTNFDLFEVARCPKPPSSLGSIKFTGSISIQSTDELRVLVELLCHSKDLK